MPKLLRQQNNDGILLFFCPGCDCGHQVHVAGERNPHTGAQWQWNGSLDAPTFSPSLLIRSGHFIDGKHPCWCDYNREHAEKPASFSCSVCHSFVRDGRIEFLNDCTHKLKGQTVPLPEWQ